MNKNENIFSNKDLPPINGRIYKVIEFYTKGSVKAFSELIGLSNSQKLNRIFNIDKRNNDYPDVSSETLTGIANKFSEINLNWLLKGEGSMLNNDLPFDHPPKDTMLYNMYKEQQKEIRSLLEEIGVLKERLRQYQSQIETFQDLPSIRSDSANNTGNQKKYISKKDVTAPNATKELVKNASKHDSKISAATSVAVNSTKQQSGTKKKV